MNYPQPASSADLLNLMLPNGAFGDNIYAHLEPEKQITAQYGLTDKVRYESITGGTITAEDSLFKVSIDNTVNAYAELTTVNPIVYKAGQGIRLRASATFSDAPVDSVQTVGLFSKANGLFFGKWDGRMAIMHRQNGKVEIQKITVSNTGTGGVVFTINDKIVNVILTGGTEEHNAYQIAEVFRAIPEWDVDQVGNIVYIVAHSGGTRDGTYSIANSSTATLSIERIQAGIECTCDKYYQEDWLINKMPNLDPSKLNAYQIRMPYLGAANILFDIYDPDIDRFVHVHTIKYANKNVIPLVSNPSFYGGWFVQSKGSNVPLEVTGASLALFIEGKSKLTAGSREDSVQAVDVDANNINHLITIKCREEMNGHQNMGFILPHYSSFYTAGSRGTRFIFLKNANIGEYNYSYEDTDNSIALVTKHTGVVTGGREIAARTIGATSDRELYLNDLGNILAPGETLTVGAIQISGQAAECDATLIWKEDV